MKSALDTMEPIERVTLGDRVHEELCDLLMAGKLFPGDKLSLRNVAATMGVSMMPVREAVTRLVAEEALTVAPNRAVSVPVMTLTRLRELTLIRSEIEGFAVAQAALHRTDKELMRMRSLDEQFRAAVKSDSPNAEKSLKLNKDLHFAVYNAARLPLLSGIIQGLWLKVGPVINLDLRSSSERLRSGDAEQCHARLVAAIEAHEPDKARAALTDDILSSSQFIQSTGILPD
ncbi:GntR family transcriptional regulator [Manganibacter manganicus]|uniref:GntR family transcriptional regulator n=1 Tax=Manganibacter manganicus TaxID=1873176 RepID=A0A1V8RS64_9HYPH|nr:GntR family transcriptional regulator [Pseudaminobacter manganicus]OQM76062.1 GntR family transcriptional regulator [Pseudaminobacter manganicus]